MRKALFLRMRRTVISYLQDKETPFCKTVLRETKKTVIFGTEFWETIKTVLCETRKTVTCEVKRTDPKNKKLRITPAPLPKKIRTSLSRNNPQARKYDVNDTEHGLSSQSAKIKQAACSTIHAPS